MKRCIALILVIACMMSLAGCAVFSPVTKTYRSYEAFAAKHKPGMEKQQVLEKLGCPSGYRDAQNDYHARGNDNREQFEQDILAADATTWFYACYKFSDPADPYLLRIVFDAEGKSVSAELVVVYGG